MMPSRWRDSFTFAPFNHASSRCIFAALTALLAVAAVKAPVTAATTGSNVVAGAVAPTTADVTAARAAVASKTLRLTTTPTVSLRTTPPYRIGVAPLSAVPPGSAPPFPSIIYPEDLYYFGGPVIKSAKFTNIYVNCAYSCWGKPGKVLRDFFASNFVHVLDQYTGATASGRYTYAGDFPETYPFYSHILYENDILAIVHAAAVKRGNKPYGAMFHVFLPPGEDTCFDGTTECYSPDIPSTFAFCGYHGSVTFSDVGHVIYSVLPFADTPDCTTLNSSPNGLLAETTDSVLSHETSEAITDPDIDAWLTYPFGNEIGDNCAYLYNYEYLSGVKYEVQTEYSNIVHGCVGNYVP